MLSLPIHSDLPQTKRDSSALHPEDWSIGDWGTIGGAITAAIAWFWRHTIRELFVWVKNAIQAPNRIEQLALVISKLQMDVTTAITMTRATWGSIDRCIWESDASGLCVYVNPYFLQRVGRQPLDILGDSWRTLVHQGDRDMVYREWDASIKQKRDFDLKYRLVAFDGEIINIHAQTSRLLAANGAISGWVAFVTELKPETKQPDHAD